MGNIFVVGACTAGKEVGKVASFVGKIFVVRSPTTKNTNILPHKNYTLYGSHHASLAFCIWDMYRLTQLNQEHDNTSWKR